MINNYKIIAQYVYDIDLPKLKESTGRISFPRARKSENYT